MINVGLAHFNCIKPARWLVSTPCSASAIWINLPTQALYSTCNNSVAWMMLSREEAILIDVLSMQIVWFPFMLQDFLPSLGEEGGAGVSLQF